MLPIQKPFALSRVLKGYTSPMHFPAATFPKSGIQILRENEVNSTKAGKCFQREIGTSPQTMCSSFWDFGILFGYCDSILSRFWSFKLLWFYFEILRFCFHYCNPVLRFCVSVLGFRVSVFVYLLFRDFAGFLVCLFLYHRRSYG